MNTESLTQRTDLIAALASAGITTDDPVRDRDAVARLLPDRTDLLEAIDATADTEPPSAPRDALELRASRVPLQMACPGAARVPRVRIRESGGAADMGTAAHVSLQRVAEFGYPCWDQIPAIASQHGVDEEELRMLVAMGNKLWGQIWESFPNALTEQSMFLALPTGHTLTGTADVISVASNAIRIADWKTGRKDSDHRDQLRAYAAMALLSDEDGPSEATATALWVRDQEIENVTMTRAEANAWVQRYTDRVIRWDGVYRPGERCAHCPRGHECDARSALVSRSIAAIVGRDSPGLDMMEPAAILELHEKVKLIESVAEKVGKAIRAKVEQGDIVAGGKRLTIATETRRRLLTVPAFEVLQGLGFGDAEWAECMSVSPSKVDKLVSYRAGKGQGAAAVRDLQERLEQADAVRTFEVRKLVTRRTGT